MAGGSRGTDSHDMATILDPFRAIFVDLGPNGLSETWTVETSETSTCCVGTGQISSLATVNIYGVSTADICPVSAADICPVSTNVFFLLSEGVRSQIGISGGARNADLGSDPL